MTFLLLLIIYIFYTIKLLIASIRTVKNSAIDKYEKSVSHKNGIATRSIACQFVLISNVFIIMKYMAYIYIIKDAKIIMT